MQRFQFFEIIRNKRKSKDEIFHIFQFRIHDPKVPRPTLRLGNVKTIVNYFFILIFGIDFNAL